MPHQTLERVTGLQVDCIPMKNWTTEGGGGGGRWREGKERNGSYGIFACIEQGHVRGRPSSAMANEAWKNRSQKITSVNK